MEVMGISGLQDEQNAYLCHHCIYAYIGDSDRHSHMQKKLGDGFNIRRHTAVNVLYLIILSYSTLIAFFGTHRSISQPHANGRNSGDRPLLGLGLVQDWLLKQQLCLCPLIFQPWLTCQRPQQDLGIDSAELSSSNLMI